MAQLLYRILNAPLLILLTLIGVAIQTSVFSMWFLRYLQPDVILLIVIWCALKRELVEGGIIVLILGLIAENHSAAPQGLFMIVYMGIYLGIVSVSRMILISNLNARILLALGTTVFNRFFTLTLLILLGVDLPPWKTSLLQLIPTALVNGICSRWVFEWLEKFDRTTFKTLVPESSSIEDLPYEPKG